MAFDRLFGKQRSNGHQPPGVVGTRSARVPIVGQPYDVRGWQITALVVCKCEPTLHPLLVTAAGVTQCRGCKKLFTIQGVQIAPGTPPQFMIGVALPDQAESASADAPAPTR